MPLDIKLIDDIEENKLEDKYFYYRYGFRGTRVIDSAVERNKQFIKNNGILLDKVNSFNKDFLKQVYNKVKFLNQNLIIHKI